MSTNSPLETPSLAPALETWEDERGNSTTFARIEISDPMEFIRQGNRSGFRCAASYLAEQTGLQLSSNEQLGPEPVIMVGAPGKAELYDGRNKDDGRRWYDFTQPEPGRYSVEAMGKMNGDTHIVFFPGEVAYLGMVSGKISDESTPELPSQELFRNLTQAANQQRRGRVGRAFNGLFGR